MNRNTKKHIGPICVAVAIAALVTSPAIAIGQEHNHSHVNGSHADHDHADHDHADHDHADHDHAGHDHAGHGDHNHSGELLAFQLPSWKSMHFDDADKAAQHAATVNKLGCEVKQDNHAGHIDVTYRCVKWKSLQVKNHQLAEHWSKWLTASGFDVSHGHTDPVYTKGTEVVEFRLVPWKQVHGDGSPNEAAFIDQMRRLGVDVRVEKHNGHSDIKFRAPIWRDVHLASHDDADKLMAWLKQSGFEVRHEH